MIMKITAMADYIGPRMFLEPPGFEQLSMEDLMTGICVGLFVSSYSIILSSNEASNMRN